MAFGTCVICVLKWGKKERDLRACLIACQGSSWCSSIWEQLKWDFPPWRTKQGQLTRGQLVLVANVFKKLLSLIWNSFAAFLEIVWLWFLRSFSSVNSNRMLKAQMRKITNCKLIGRCCRFVFPLWTKVKFDRADVLGKASSSGWTWVSANFKSGHRWLVYLEPHGRLLNCYSETTVSKLTSPK